MDNLNICLFGEPTVSLGDGPALRFPTQKSLELIAFAALSRDRRVMRERIATALREDMLETRSRKALSTDLWRVRQSFTEAGADSGAYLFADRHALGFHRDAPVLVDVTRFEDAADAALAVGAGRLTPELAGALSDALALHRADLLSSFDRNWCMVLREKLRAKYSACLDLLLRFEQIADAWPRALFWAERLADLDPLLEHAHRAIMRCHFLMGNRGAAIRQYASCAAVLRKELDIEPAEETQRMYRGLLSVQQNVAEATQPAPDADATALEPQTSRPAGRAGHREPNSPLTDQLTLALGNLSTACRLIENVDAKLRQGERG